MSSPTASPRQPARRLVRSTTDRWVAGVAGGLGSWLGVDAILVRLVFVVLTLAGGLGLVLYGLVWSATREAPTTPRHHDRQAVALGVLMIGILGLMRAAGLWLGDSVVWPLVAAAVGSALIWTRGDEADRRRWRRLARLPDEPGPPDEGSVPRGRLLVGAGLVAFGSIVFLAVRSDLATLGQVLLAVLVTAAGAGLIAGPWILGLVRRMDAERRVRIRSEERAEVAAHLHDSVLQTLALIQRANAPADVRTLARRQERELRAWLFGTRSSDARDLRAAVEALVDEVEAHHPVAVETVVVGDTTLDGAAGVAVQACREAVTNAALHAGVDSVALYLESDERGITAFVRDRGKGFDPATVPTDRHGIADSIVGRVRRAGGRAEVRSTPRDGTEVEIHVPRVGPPRGRGDVSTEAARS